MIEEVDILIVGGGLTGAILMLALTNQGYNCLLVDLSPLSDKVSADFDARSLALSTASVRILEQLELWPLIKPYATAIETIHVSEQRRFGSAHMYGTPDKPLGYVVEMQPINRALNQCLENKQLRAPARLIGLDKERGVATISSSAGETQIKARLIVAADGSESTVRHLAGLPAKKKNYGQHAIVSNVGLARDHHHRAYERFTPSGPLALLPMTDKRMSLVWALEPTEAEELMALDDHAFLNLLQKAFGYRLGRFIRIGKRTLYPLIEVTMPQQVSWPLVFVGNAAHTLHPVAGQGFNLGLRDVATLAQCIIQYGLNEAMLSHYQDKRRYDQQAIIKLTGGLVDVFTSKIPGMALVRNLGLIALDNSAFLKRHLMRYTGGFAGIIPDLVCGIGLDNKELK